MAGILGPEAVIDGAAGRWAVEGLTPAAVVCPRSMEEAACVLRWACEENIGVVPQGGGTLIHAGYAPDRDFIVISLGLMNRLVNYQPADMTITLEAGMTLAALQSILAEKGQFLPVDPPCPRQATLGGLIATASSGPSRYGYGTLRDMLLGIRTAMPDGSIVKGGGRVVKNVAGYDTPKLFTGSWGTLGVIGEITFKVRPLPSATATALWGFEHPDQAEPLVAALIDSDLLPAFLELTSASLLQDALPDSLSNAPFILSAGFDGNREAVAWQLEHAGGIVQGKGMAAPVVLRGEAEKGCRAALSESIAVGGAALFCKASLLSSQVTAFCERAGKAARELSLPVAVACHAGSGIVHLRLADGPDNVAIAWLERIGEAAQAAGGNLVVLKGSPAVKRAVPVWGRPTGDRDLMKRVKAKLDPKGILNPGRYVG
ncbi:MAG: FAD-binding oxidoreductase [Armatimonadetes bacterium]|nr:FAD-binding oxidoreductase [Armatimonadota bacterium]